MITPAPRAGRTGPAEPLGPGRLVLVVGPSGAGKDTVIGLARDALTDVPRIAFPRRVVTRPADASEDHDTLGESEFANAEREGAFALTWAAHGLHYGIPAHIDSDIAAGRTVVCNVSRTAIEQARERYCNVAVVLITAPADMLKERLTARGRDSDTDVSARLNRASAEIAPDHVIHNATTPQAALAAFIGYISP